MTANEIYRLFILRVYRNDTKMEKIEIMNACTHFPKKFPKFIPSST